MRGSASTVAEHKELIGRITPSYSQCEGTDEREVIGIIVLPISIPPHRPQLRIGFFCAGEMAELQRGAFHTERRIVATGLSQNANRSARELAQEAKLGGQERHWARQQHHD